jgi:mono/diheme cytochrome c family protein
MTPPRERDDPALERSLDRQLMLGLVFGVLLLAGFPLYAIREPERLQRATAEQWEQYTRLGSDQFALHCAACHGAEGMGGGPAPTLRAREFLSAVTDQQLRWFIAGGRPGTTMSPYHIDFGGPFTEQHIDQVVVYLRSLEPDAQPVPEWKTGAPAPPAPTAAPSATPPAATATPAGETAALAASIDDSAITARASAQLYAQRCAACHGAQGQGVAGLGIAILTPTYLMNRADSTLARIIAEGVPGTAMMAFTGSSGGLLSAEQIQALVRWMRAQGLNGR